MDVASKRPASFSIRSQFVVGLAGLALASAIGALLLVAAHGNLWHGFIAILALFVAAAAIPVGGLFVLLTRRTNGLRLWQIWSWLATSSFVVAMVAAAVVISCLLGPLWDDWRSRPTLAWCEQVVGRIQTFEAVHGRYPDSLEELGDFRHPWWAREIEYQRAGTTFTLMFGGDCDWDEPRSGFDGTRCAWIVRGDGPETPLEGVPYQEQWRYTQGR